jgi:hypothetical protein
MKQHFRVVLVALLMLAPLPRAALAQRTYALGVGGGAAVPVGKFSDTQKPGFNGLVVLAIGVAELPFGVRFDGIYNTFEFRTDPAPGASSSDPRVMGALFNIIFAFPGTTAKPYLIAGGGLYNTKGDVPGAKSENNFGFNAGLGTTLGFGPFAAFLESRYHTISRSDAEGGVVQFVPITVGLLF